jgi:ankyrin repeat protein
MTTLFLSIQNGDIKNIKKLYTLQRDTFAQHGISPLHLAVVFGIPTVFDTLLELGEDIYQKTRIGETVLLYAAGQSLNLKNGVIEKLIKLSGRSLLYEVDRFGFTPAHAAANHNNTDIVKLFVDLDNQLVHTKTDADMTLLHFAADHSNIDLIEYLAKLGADMNAIDCRGNTAMHVVFNQYSHGIAHQKSETFKTLVKFGCNSFDTKNNNGIQPLMYTRFIDTKQLEFFSIKTLIMLGADPTEYLLLCEENNCDPVEWSEDDLLQVRYEVYFEWGLLDRLLFYFL